MNAGRQTGTGAGENGRAVKDEAYRESAGVGAEGKARVCRKDSGELPATDQGVDESVGIGGEGAATTEGQVIDAISGKKMSDVEVRRAAANMEVGSIAHQTAND